MKSLFDYIQENEGGVFSTPSNTMGMGNPGVLPDGNLTEPIVTAKCKKEKLKKKKVSESILDDEDELIKQTKDSTKWWNTVYNILVRNSSSSNMVAMQEVCINWLNEHVKFSNNPKVQWYKDSPIWQGHTHTTYGTMGYNGISLMSFDADPGHNDLYVYFPDMRRMRPKYKETYIKGLREEFNMTEKDYINFKQDIIDKFKLIQDRHFASGDVWKSELK
jgi:hypothetical protein